MPDRTVEEKPSISPRDQWRERIAEQARSGLSIKQFCKGRGIAEHVFYYWRKRLRQTEPCASPDPTEWNLELLLVSGERLRIGACVEAATLRIVLEALRA